LRGKATGSLESLYCAPGFGTHPRRKVDRAFVVERGKPQATSKPDCPKRSRKRCVGRWPKPRFNTVCCHEWRHTRDRRRSELHHTPSRSAGTGASSKPRNRPKPQSERRSYPVGDSRPKPGATARVPSGFQLAKPHAEASGCAAPSARKMPPTDEPPKWIAGARHAAGIRRQLPWGSGPFGVSTQAIVVLVCLASTIRSQSFSLSQRFEPAWALWLCFTPHPPLGFWPSELFPPSQL